MDTKEARGTLKSMGLEQLDFYALRKDSVDLPPGLSQDNVDLLVYPDDAVGVASLKGDFTSDQLMAIAVWMKNPFDSY